MNTTSESGSTASSNRSRAIRNVALPVPVAAGSIVVALGPGAPVLAGRYLNHNETLLPATVDAVPPERRNRRWRRAATSALVVSASLALGAVAFGFGSSPGSGHGKMHLDDISLGIIT